MAGHQNPETPQALDASLNPRWRAYADKLEIGTPWVFTASAVALLVFLGLATWVNDGASRAIDEQILLSLRSAVDPTNPIGPKWFEGAVRDITSLGGFSVLAILVLSISGFLFATGRQQAGFRIFAIALSGWLLSQIVKQVFQRARPDLVPHGADVFSSSFPSGHAMVSAVVYLTLGMALARTTDNVRVKTYIMALAVMLILAVGASRVYLGVHWPTDVLGGWVLGGAWVGLAWIAVRRYEDWWRPS